MPSRSSDIPAAGGLHGFLPDPGGSRSSAVSREEAGHCFFRAFLRIKKSSKSAASPSAELGEEVSSWTPAAYDTQPMPPRALQAFPGTRHCELLDVGALRGRPAMVPLAHGSFSVVPATGILSCRCAGGWSWSRPGLMVMALWTVCEMACFLGSLDDIVPVIMQSKFQQFVPICSGCLTFSSSTSAGLTVMTQRQVRTVPTVQEYVVTPQPQFLGMEFKCPLLCN